MPESPEITYMVENIKNIKNKILENIIINKYSKYSKIEIKNYKNLKKEFPIEIKDIYNIGKRIFIILNNKYNIILNMGMTGNISTYKDTKYNSLEFIIKDSNNFYMNDLRKFATIRITKNLEKYENEMGYDALNQKITFDEFYNKYILNKKTNKILALRLMDQNVFAGIGNYLRAEILYDTQIDPFCKVNNIPKRYWKKIYKSYNKIVNKSYNNQKKFINYFEFNAYRRNDKKDIISKKINNRTLWYSEKRIKYRC